MGSTPGGRGGTREQRRDRALATWLSPMEVSKEGANGLAMHKAAGTLGDEGRRHVRTAFNAAQLSSPLHRLLIDRRSNALHERCTVLSQRANSKCIVKALRQTSGLVGSSQSSLQDFHGRDWRDPDAIVEPDERARCLEFAQAVNEGDHDVDF